MKLGDFSELAKYYHSRPAYPQAMVKYILDIAGLSAKSEFNIAEAGAGTGKMTAVMRAVAPNAKIIAVEPNDEMRAEGIKAVPSVEFIKGTGENTTLSDNFADFACMASSFHWTDHTKSLPEFKRILKPGGFFCVISNSRDVEKNKLMLEIENEIYKMIPNLIRNTSDTDKKPRNYDEILISTGDFKDCVEMKMPYTEKFSKERYMAAWKSVNDIQAQAIEQGGKKLWEDVLTMIEHKISGLDNIIQYYIIKAFVVKSTK